MLSIAKKTGSLGIRGGTEQVQERWRSARMKKNAAGRLSCHAALLKVKLEEA
jgi:hypothetical protein